MRFLSVFLLCANASPSCRKCKCAAHRRSDICIPVRVYLNGVFSPPPQVVALNKRSKEAESAFLGIYKQLIEAPGESPTKTRDVHLRKQQQQQRYKHRTHSHTLLRELSPPPPLLKITPRRSAPHQTSTTIAGKTQTDVSWIYEATYANRKVIFSP